MGSVGLLVFRFKLGVDYIIVAFSSDFTFFRCRTLSGVGSGLRFAACGGLLLGGFFV
jgi:hypothetical protein